MSNIVSRIKEFVDYKGLSVRKFEEKVGFSNGAFASQYKNNGSIGSDKIENILQSYPEINVIWLLTGEGEMLKEEEILPVAIHTNNPKKGIPLIPVEAMAGIANGEVSVLEMDCERYIIPMFKDADYLIMVKGDSMYPRYSSGDVVACKKLPLSDLFFQWNKPYVIDTEQGGLIKKVCKSTKKNCIKLVSENPEYEPFDLHKSQIYAIALVIGTVRLE